MEISVTSLYQIDCDSQIVYFLQQEQLILVAEVRAFHNSIPKSNRMSKVSLLATVTSVAKGDRSYLQTRSCDSRIVIKAVLKVFIKKCKEEGKLRLDYPSSSRMTD